MRKIRKTGAIQTRDKVRSITNPNLTGRVMEAHRDHLLITWHDEDRFMPEWVERNSVEHAPVTA